MTDFEKTFELDGKDSDEQAEQLDKSITVEDRQEELRQIEAEEAKMSK